MIGTTNRVTLEAHDTTFAEGKIGLTSDMPTRFDAVRVTATLKSGRSPSRPVPRDRPRKTAWWRRNPRMVLWRKMALGDFGTGRCLRFGELNGDGKLDVLVVQQRRYGQGSHSEVGCLTAMTFDGQILWQNGSPDPWNDRLSNDVGVQIHDLTATGATR